jgi:hypothetical protein
LVAIHHKCGFGKEAPLPDRLAGRFRLAPVSVEQQLGDTRAHRDLADLSGRGRLSVLAQQGELDER